MRAVYVNLKKNKSIGIIETEKVKIPQPRKNEILFKTLACGVCQTDIESILSFRRYKKNNKNLDGSPGKKYLGHEVVGKAIKVGKNLNKNIIGKNFIIGDKNICRSFNMSPECENCKKNRGIFCLKKSSRKFNDKTYGGYSDYFVRSYYQSEKINNSVNPKFGIFAEPIACAINCSRRYVNGSILIYGLGTISLLFYRILLINKINEDKIFLLVKNNEQLKQARLIGYKNIILKNKLNSLHNIFDNLFYFNGKIDLDRIILKNLKPLSKIVLFGSIKKLNFDPLILVKKEITIKGIHGYSSYFKNGKYFSDLRTAVKYIEKNKIYLNDLVKNIIRFKYLKKTLNKICKNVRSGSKKAVFRSIFYK